MVGTLTFGSETIRYEVLYLASRRTLAIEVHPDSRVFVRAPTDCAAATIAERMQKRAAWISRQLAEFERYAPRTPIRQYVSGESHLYLGRQYKLKVEAAPSTQVSLSRGSLLVRLPGRPTPQRVKAAMQSWYLERAKAIYTEILGTCMRHFAGCATPKLAMRSMQTRWGSLSPAGTMTLNANLVRAPRPCIEYVIIHELCHMRHRNHDSRFFQLLEQLLPDWKQRKRRLEAALL